VVICSHIYMSLLSLYMLRKLISLRNNKDYLKCIIDTIHCIIHCTLHTLYYRHYTLHYTVLTVHSSLYTVYQQPLTTSWAFLCSSSTCAVCCWIISSSCCRSICCWESSCSWAWAAWCSELAPPPTPPWPPYTPGHIPGTPVPAPPPPRSSMSPPPAPVCGWRREVEVIKEAYYRPPGVSVDGHSKPFQKTVSSLVFDSVSVHLEVC